MKTWKKIIFAIVVVIVIIPAVASVAIQIPAVQTAVVGKVTEVLSRKLDGRVSVGKVYLSFPNNLILNDVCAIYGERDTVACVGKVLLDIKAASLLGDEAVVKRISVEDGFLRLSKIDENTTNLSALIAPLIDKDKEKSEFSMPFSKISVGKLTLKNLAFSTSNPFVETNPDRNPLAIDWANLDLRNINLDARNIEYADSLTLNLRSLTLNEGNGLAINDFGGNVSLSDNLIMVRDLRYNDGYSDLKADWFSLGMDSFADFSDFCNKVNMGADFNKTVFDFRTLQYYAGMKEMGLGIEIDGKVTGPVRDLKADNLTVHSRSGSTALNIAAHIKGLPDINSTDFNVKIKNSSTSTADIADILAEINPGFNKASIKKFVPGEKLVLKADVNGRLANLKAAGNLSTSASGTLDFDLLGHLAKGFAAEGSVKAQSLNLGNILSNQSLGLLTCNADVDLSTKGGKLQAAASPVNIDRLDFNGYQYSDITATCLYENDQVQAYIVSNDPNLDLAINGAITLGGKGSGNDFQVSMDLSNINLSALNFLKGDTTSVSMKMDADIKQTANGVLLGTAKISDLTANVNNETYEIGDITVDSHSADSSYVLHLESSLAVIDYFGDIFVTDFINQAKATVVNDNLNNLVAAKNGSKTAIDSSAYGFLTVRPIDLTPVLKMFTDDIFIANSTSIGATLESGQFSCDIISPVVAFGNNYLKDISGLVYTDRGELRAAFEVDKFQTGNFTAENINLKSFINDNKINLNFGFKDNDPAGNSADIKAVISLLNGEMTQDKIKAEICPSSLNVLGKSWSLSAPEICYRDKHISIDSFRLNSGEQSLLIDGNVGQSIADTVNFSLNNFDIGLANIFLGDNLNLEGSLTGEGEAFALLGDQKGILMDLHGQDVGLSGEKLGDLDILCKWDDQNDRINIELDNRLDGNSPLKATAYFSPKTKAIGADVGIDGLSLKIIEPIASSVISNVSGNLTGNLGITGTSDNLSITSQGTRLDSLRFRLNFTQVDYLLDGPVDIDDSGVKLDGIKIEDKYHNKGAASGGVVFNKFKDIRLNIGIKAFNLLGLNTTLADNSTFYGKAFATGDIRLMGPLNKIMLLMRVRPEENTVIHIPLGSSATEKASLLTFINNRVEKLDLFDSLRLAKTVKSEEAKSSSEFNLMLNLDANPNAEIQLEINKATGDILKARGNGQIGINVGSDLFDIKGDYTVDSGSYHFGMLGFTSRDFSINPGGSISFNGDIMDTDLDLTANYRTKASISTLIADSTAVSTRRTVDCGIGVAGKLANPELSFNIDIPDLDPTTKSKVESALNTEDKRMKQILALLVSGGFVPDEQSGIVNSTTVLYSNASEMMANQLNNIFRQLDIPLDLGFNYQPSQTGRDIFDVAVSTQLFNNRVSINGNIGNRQYMSSTSNSDIVGDLDIEIKLNKQGQWRLKLFSHSADKFSNYLDQNQRNGAGIVFQEEFNRFSDLWRRLFRRKKDEQRQAPSDSNPAGRPRPGEGSAGQRP